MITKPKGTYDLINRDARIYKYLSSIIDEFMTMYNYEYIRTPIFENTSLFHRGVGEETDIVSKETYDFKDRGDRDLTLRPEGTAGVVRSFIENKLYGNRNDAVKLYYNGTMYRYERPQAGRNREFTQFGAEVFGSNSTLIDAEVISMGYHLLECFGINNVLVKINSLGNNQDRKKYTDALVNYLTPQINDLCEDCQRRIKTNPLRILDCKVDEDSTILKNVPKISDYLSEESKNRFNKVKYMLNLLDVDYEVDEKIVRGLDYYDENVWEYVSDDLTLGGGGRYNSLVKKLDGPDTPAIGFAFGLERIILKLKETMNIEKFKNDIDVYIMCVSEEEKIKALQLSQDLRLNNIIVELNNNDLSFKSQFKVADLYHAKFLIILKDDDLQKGLITIKDNSLKEEIKVDECEVIDWLLGNI